MCSFAKFLALGLIASEGHGPVFADAAGPAGNPTTEATGIKAVVYENIVGKAIKETNEVTIMHEACKMMNKAHNQEKGNNADGWGTASDFTCDHNQYETIKTAMLTLWKKQVVSTTEPTGGWKLDTADGNVKIQLIKEYKAEFERLAGPDEKTPHNPETTEYYEQIKDLRDAVKDKIWVQAQNTAWRAKNIAAKALPTSNPGWREVAENIVTKSGEPFTHSETPVTLPDARQKLADAEALLRGANAAFTYVDNARKEEISRETVGGFFGVFFGLVGLTLAFLMSPCVQFDFNTGKTATNWATGEVDDEWTQMEMYKEAYKTDKTPEQWRNEVFGLPEQPVDSAKATSSALTLVPVVVLAGGVFAVARRGLKRRAQKKAKRVSRAQQKLHEDL